MSMNDMAKVDSNGELFSREAVERLWKVWSKQLQEQTELSEKMDFVLTFDKTETEIFLEKTSMWNIKNQTMTTRLGDYQEYVRRSREIVDEKNYIENLLKNDMYEPGVVSEVQKYAEERLRCEKEKTQSILQSIYLENYDHTSVFVNLLQVISQIEYSLIEPAGPIMALAATRHKDCEVREFGLRCYENWEDLKCIPILKNLHFEEEWLQNYLDMLIADLEEVD